ncbi:hypothetical protein [Niveispirillum irakense]|uniref:hypothetical protein n=1 Tax=Niveispirillum irakense TaxID=34011 RepID=UPI0012B65880|nr:hypothetical protein [Niveispirillum irakense]
MADAYNTFPGSRAGQRRPFSLSVVTYMLPAGFWSALGADSKNPGKILILQGLYWMWKIGLADGATTLP